MLVEAQTGSLRLRLAERVFTDSTARRRLIESYEKRLVEIPEHADVALVLGNSMKLFPDRYLKRIYVSHILAKVGKVKEIIFTGDNDHDYRNENQAEIAREVAIKNFGTDSVKISLVGGDNTEKNLVCARDFIFENKPATNSIFLISENFHLLRVLPQADWIFGESKIDIYPYPVPLEEQLDVNDPGVIRELVKSLIYNRTLARTARPFVGPKKGEIDNYINRITSITIGMPQIKKMPFGEWKPLVDELFAV